MLHNNHKYVQTAIEVFIEENPSKAEPLTEILGSLKAVPLLDFDCSCQKDEPCAEHKQGLRDFKEMLQGEFNDSKIVYPLYAKLAMIPIDHHYALLEVQSYFVSKFKEPLFRYYNDEKHFIFTSALKNQSWLLQNLGLNGHVKLLQMRKEVVVLALSTIASCVLFGEGLAKKSS